MSDNKPGPGWGMDGEQRGPSHRREMFSMDPGAKMDARMQALADRALEKEHKSSTLGLIAGAVIALLGGGLLYFGAAHGTHLVVSLLGLEVEATDTGPGAVIMVIGVLVILATRPKVKFKR